MDFQSWIKAVVLEECQREQISESALARKIGISQSLLNSYTTGSRPAPKTKRIIDSLVDYFKDSHPEVYTIFGLPHPTEPLDAFPPAVRAALESAMSQIVAGGFDADSPEAVKIFDEAITALGYKRISSLDNESSA